MTSGVEIREITKDDDVEQYEPRKTLGLVRRNVIGSRLMVDYGLLYRCKGIFRDFRPLHFDSGGPNGSIL